MRLVACRRLLASLLPKSARIAKRVAVGLFDFAPRWMRKRLTRKGRLIWKGGALLVAATASEKSGHAMEACLLRGRRAAETGSVAPSFLSRRPVRAFEEAVQWPAGDTAKWPRREHLEEVPGRSSRRDPWALPARLGLWAGLGLQPLGVLAGTVNAVFDALLCVQFQTKRG